MKIKLSSVLVKKLKSGKINITLNRKGARTLLHDLIRAKKGHNGSTWIGDKIINQFRKLRIKLYYEEYKP